MFESFSERAKLVRSRNRVAMIFGHGFLDAPPSHQKQALTLMLKGLPAGKSRRDVLLASFFERVELDAPYSEQRQLVVDEYKALVKKREDGKAVRKAEKAAKKAEEEQREKDRQDFERWRAAMQRSGDGDARMSPAETGR